MLTRLLEDHDKANPLGKLWTVYEKTLAVLGESALDLLGTLIHELALDGVIVDCGGEVGDGILGHIIEGEVFQVLV